MQRHWRRSLAFLVGMLFVGVAIALLARAGLGFAPYDMLASGISRRLQIELGTASWLAAVVSCLLAWTLGRRPGLGTLFLAFGVGAVIDICLRILPLIESLLGRGALATLGLILLWLAVSLIVASEYGSGPPELIMLALTGRGWSVQRARWAIEAGFFAIGIILGGTFGVVTILLVFATGPILQLTIPRCARLLGTQPPDRPHPR